MDRRSVLKTLFVSTGMLVILPDWASGWTKESVISPQNLFTKDEKSTLKSVADTIIPAGNSIGAISVGVDLFLLKLFDKCYPTEIQNNIKAQLLGLEESAKKSFSTSFSQCSQQQREQLLNNLVVSEEKIQNDFFNLVKSETIRGFSTSKEVMTNYLNYKSAPGHYFGCVDVKS